jgi:2-iminobutanoate/2-iminopropanoate deaminase
MKSIKTETAPAPLGHYDQAQDHNGTLYISGQLPIDTFDSAKEFKTIEEQTLQTLKNLESVAIAAGYSKEDIIKVTIFISDIKLWASANKVYGEFFGEHKPARSAVPVPELPRGYFVEIEGVAVRS